MKKLLRIGTRDSELALWQAITVRKGLESLGYTCDLVPVKATGDLVLDKPLYELGVTGIFTKTLDVALLKGEIDLAVHSLKDVPTMLPEGLEQAAVLARANPTDILVHKGTDFLNSEGVVATGSLRRKAQWLRRYPQHEIVDLRGNVNTRLQKLQDENWNAAIFAAAGLERINLLPRNHHSLHWMLPAPAQGAMVVVVRSDDTLCKKAVLPLNHTDSALCTSVEREFLRELEGGCTAPIGALASISDDQLRLRAGLFALDGSEAILIDRETGRNTAEGFGKSCAQEVLQNGGEALMKAIRKEMVR